MRQNVPLGRVAGIRIGFNVGALVVFVLLAAGLALGRLPAVEPGRGPVAYLIAGVAAAVLFLASILVHELAHTVVAQANGVPVEAITLWLLGGVAELRGEPRSPGTAAAVGAVGPLASAGLGALFWATGAALSAVGADRLTMGTGAAPVSSPPAPAGSSGCCSSRQAWLSCCSWATGSAGSGGCCWAGSSCRRPPPRRNARGSAVACTGCGWPT
ncbi:MAG: hypothetical protein AUI14_12535 [Actinobacteria bacterium 13_2_20CM_2_71_6]|nr:MAG: hypothetical protein AUI14_12535 [Actinobacteria bacterium 13_2_20CM_2_71_6]